MGQCTSDPKSNSSTNNDNYHFDKTCQTASVKKSSVLAEKKKLVIEPMVKIDISDESIYQSDFESDNDCYGYGDAELEMQNQHPSKSRRTSYSAAEPILTEVVGPPEPLAAPPASSASSIFMVEEVVKKSGCETFVINFNDDKPVVQKKKLPRPKTTAACSTRLKVKPSKDIDFSSNKPAVVDGSKRQRQHDSQEVNTSKVLDKRRRGLRSAFATRAGRPKKTATAESGKPARVTTATSASARGRLIELSAA